MALALEVKEVPEGLETAYRADGDKFVLDVEGVVSESTVDDLTSQIATLTNELNDTKGKVAKFRETNTGLMKQIKNSGGQVDDNFNVDINAAIEEALKPIKDKNEVLMKQNTELQGVLEEVVLSDKVKDIAIRHGVVESALPDIVSRARDVFTVKDGKTIPKSANSRDADGKLIEPDTWISALAESAPHLFKPSNGTGAVKPNGKGNPNGQMSANDKILAGLKERGITGA